MGGDLLCYRRVQTGEPEILLSDVGSSELSITQYQTLSAEILARWVRVHVLKCLRKTEQRAIHNTL